MTAWALDVRRDRAAKNQSLFREVNERIDELSGSATFLTFIWECANETCCIDHADLTVYGHRVSK
jgi:hypothetical protein